MSARVLLTSFLLLLGTAIAAAQSLTFDPPANLASPPSEALRSESGLVSLQLAAGEGTVHAVESDVVKVQYVVWSPEGKKIDGVIAPKMAVIPVNSMLPGWREGIAQMVEGEHRRFWVPEALATKGKTYHAGGLVIDTILLGIVHMPSPPADLAAVPADAARSKSGLAWKVLKAGNGSVRPTKKSRVLVNYTGWTADGKMFDSSLLRGAPAEFPLRGIIDGWIEALQLMSPGEERIFWIPARLAYQSKPDMPQGMLVFQIELVGVK